MIRGTFLVGAILGIGLGWGHTEGNQDTQIGPPLAPITVQTPVPAAIPDYLPSQMPTYGPQTIPTYEAPISTPILPPAPNTPITNCTQMIHPCTIKT
jgi:hypothetical protein